MTIVVEAYGASTDPATIFIQARAVAGVERPGVKLPTEALVTVYAASEGAVWGAAGGLIVSQGFSSLSLAGGVVGGLLGFVLARWYLPRVRGSASD